MLNATPEEVETLLEDILEWMMDNDYECGEVGSTIYERISRIVGDE